MFVIRIDVKLMEVSVNLIYFPFNGGIYNFYRAVDFPRYMTTLIVKIITIDLWSIITRGYFQQTIIKVINVE